MTDITVIEGNLTAADARFALVVGRWNSFVVEHLKEGAIDALRRPEIADRLADGQDVRFIEAPAGRTSAVARGAERNPLRRIIRVRLQGVVQADQPWNVLEDRFRRRPAGEWMCCH